MAKLDYSEFTEWRKQFNKFELNFDDWLKDFFTDEVNRVLRKTVLKTPVDTGDLRKAWQIESISQVGDDLQAIIVNEKEYASDVEYGHRIVSQGREVGFVNGRYMLTISVNEVQKELPKRFDSDIQSYLKRYKI